MQKNNFSILKLLIFLMFFLAILTFFLIVYIIPVMKKYKTNKLVLKKYEKIYKKQKLELKTLKKKKEKLNKKYKESLNKYTSAFDLKDLKKLLKIYIKGCNIKKETTNLYRVDGKINNMSDFFNLIDKLNKFKNIVKVAFPISIEKKEDIFFITFKVSIVNKNLK